MARMAGAAAGAAGGGRPDSGCKGEREALVQAGREHLERQDHVKAMKTFSKVLELDPADEEAGRGKVLALQRLKRPRGALRTCLVSLSHRPGCRPLLALRDELAKEVGADAEDVIAEAAAAVREAQDKERRAEPREAQEVDSEASTEAQDDEPGCPASRAKDLALNPKSQPLKSPAMEKGAAWLATAESADYRAAMKTELVALYREFYKATSTKSVSTSQYTAAEKNGLSIKGGHRHMPRPAHVDLPEDHRQPVGVLTAQELSAYNGSQGGRLLLGVHGDLFDVSDRPDKYGPEGPYSSMAGHDITWALWSGYDVDEEWDKHFDLHKARPKEERDRRFQGLMSWWAFFEQEYGSPVGRLDAYEQEWTLAAPPAVRDLCTVM